MKAQEVKAQLRANGITVREWAHANNFKPRLVYAVLQGTVKGNYGEAHKIAVALGLKPQPDIVAA